MQTLVKRIQEEAYVIDNKIVKVDHFINQQLDTTLLFEIGKEFSEVFPYATKILTIESSGIAFAVATAFHLDNAPIVFARKRKSLITGNAVYTADIHSFTKDKDRTIIVDKEFLHPNDSVLIIDDFLATGSALGGLINIVRQSGAALIGVGIVIEKGFLNGRKQCIDHGIRIHSLANIKAIENNQVYF